MIGRTRSENITDGTKIEKRKNWLCNQRWGHMNSIDRKIEKLTTFKKCHILDAFHSIFIPHCFPEKFASWPLQMHAARVPGWSFHMHFYFPSTILIQKIGRMLSIYQIYSFNFICLIFIQFSKFRYSFLLFWINWTHSIINTWKFQRMVGWIRGTEEP